MKSVDLPPNVRAIRAFEITRPCGCVEILLDKKAQPAMARRVASESCYEHKMEAKQIKRAREKGGLLCDTCGRPPWSGLMRAGNECKRVGLRYYSGQYKGGCPGLIQKVEKKKERVAAEPS